MSNRLKAPSPSPEQERVIVSQGQGMAVLAGAGTGKTTTLVAKCMRLAQQNPKARFAAVSFTERSASDLRAKLSISLAELGVPGAFNQHWVMTIHGLCGSILREFSREAGFDGEETILSEAEVQLYWKRAVESLWLDELSETLVESLEWLLDRESQESLNSLLRRSRELLLFGVLPSLKDSQEKGAQALEHVSTYVLEKYERMKRRRGVLDFNDLERGADHALNSAHVRELYHRRFELVLVDEFQDTNPVQARIIRKLCRPDASNLCVVGDPKQSIYRFRDADVSIFQDFCSQLPLVFSLTWNFRSVPGILDFTNQVCEKAFLASHMPFEALVPMRAAREDLEAVVRLDIKTPLELGQFIQSEVERGVLLHDMALLVRKVRGNEKWLKALMAAGIPIAVGSGGLFWEEARVRELVAFLKWWDNPANSLSGAIFLRAPWMAVSDLDLDRWVKQDPTFKIPFFESKHPVAVVLKPLLNQTLRPSELLMALLDAAQNNSENTIEDELGVPLLGLWHRLEEWSSQGLDFHAAVGELSTAIDENRREREVPAPRNLGSLLVLTLHGAKGLEFPHVILIDFGDKPKAPEMPLLFWDRVQGAYLGARNADGDRDQKNPTEKTWRETEKRKSLEESKRLFYVALTRARDRLILVCPELQRIPSVSGKEGEPNSVYLQEDWRAWLDHSGARPALISTAMRSSALSGHPLNPVIEPALSLGMPSLAPLTRSRWVRPRHSVTEWTLLSRCPRAYEWTFIRPVPVIPEVMESEQTGMVQKSGMTQQELGTQVHACLEQGNWSGLKRIEAEVGVDRFVAEPVIHWALSSEWMAPASSAQGRAVWSELEFEIPVLGQVLVGSMDRVVKKRSNATHYYSIIDFKVTEKRKSVDAFLEAYQTQIELYAFALRQLDKNLTLEQIEAVLVNISSATIQVIPITLGRVSIESLARLAIEIVDGKAGVPKPGPFCRFCEFRGQCEEGRRSLNVV